MAASAKDQGIKVTLRNRISNLYANTKSVFLNYGNRNDQQVTARYSNNEYEDMSMSTRNRQQPSREEVKSNHYTHMDGGKMEFVRNTSTCKTGNSIVKHESIQLPVPATKLPRLVKKKWKLLSFVSLAFCVCQTIAVIVLIIVNLQEKDSPCEGIGCLHNGTCLVADDNIICSCLNGFRGGRCEVTPCENITCQNDGECFLQNLLPRCSCRNGFSGQYCNITPCSSQPCYHNGNCSYNLSSQVPLCECPDGLYGSTCERTPCSSLTCMNNGTCIYSIDSPDFTCNCSEAFSGKYCEVTPCSSLTCLNNGTCIYSVDSPDFTCNCPTGISGRYCEVTPCSDIPCKNNGNCSVDGTGYNCSCEEGFQGNNCTELHCDFEESSVPGCVFGHDLWDSCSPWQRQSGNTPSSSTGPSRAYQGSYYMYLDSSFYQCARLVSIPLRLVSTQCLTFYYHMYRFNVGSLDVYIGNNSLWRRDGNGGNTWYFANVSLSDTVSQITFHADRGGSSSDIAIDNIKISPCR